MELLRIIAMLMIVFHHFIIHGVLVNGMGNIPFREAATGAISQIIFSGGKIGVDIFVMISGYFLIKSNLTVFKITKKLHTFWGQVWFYSIGIFLINLFGHLIPNNFQLTIGAFLPICYNTYWFATDYVVLYLLAPYLNRLLNNLNQKEHKRLAIILLMLIVVLPTFLVNSFEVCINSIILFITMYIVGAYLRLYSINIFKIKESILGLLIFIGSMLFIWCSFIFFDFGASFTHDRQLLQNSYYFVSDNSAFFVFTAAFGLFLWAKHWQIKPNKVINTIASTTFGIYLIHDNPITEVVLWEKWLHLPSMINDNFRNVIVASLIVCPIVFIICSLIEYLRQLLFVLIKKIFSDSLLS